MGGGTSPATTQQVSKVELPPWVSAAGEENYNLAKNVAGRPLEQYAGPTVAPVSGMTTSGYDLIKSLVGSTSPLYDKATGFLDKSGGLQDAATGMFNKQASTLDTTAPLYNKATGAFDKAAGVQGEAADIYRSTAGPLDIKGFLNPYTEEVENRAVSNAQREADRQALQTESRRRLAGGFGGSRGEIEDAVQSAEATRGIGDLTAALRRAGVDFATNTAIADRAGRQAAGAGLLGVGSGYQGTGTGYLNTAGGIRDTASGYGAAGSGMLGASAAAGNTAAGLGNIAAGKLAAGQTDIGNLLTAGQQDQAQGQRELDALQKQFYEKRDYPLEQLNTRLAALGMTPYGRTETTNKTATSENKGIDWATLGLGALKTIPALWAMSDRDAKTDIEKLSDGPIPMYAYRYKNDPKTYPKIVGPMAQDIEKVVPSAVKRVGRHKVVNYSNLMEVLS